MVKKKEGFSALNSFLNISALSVNCKNPDVVHKSENSNTMDTEEKYWVINQEQMNLV